MSCSECRGYQVPYCPVCGKGLPAPMEDSIDFDPIVKEIISRLTNNPNMLHDDVYEVVSDWAKPIANSDDDHTAIIDHVFEEYLRFEDVYDLYDFEDAE